MPSQKGLRKIMRAKKKFAHDAGLLDKEKQVNRAVSSCNKKIKDITKIALDKSEDNKRFKKKISDKNPTKRSLKKPSFKKSPAMPTEFDEFGAIIFRVNADDIFLSLPDFDKKFVIEKSEKYSYEDLIADTVFKAAVNNIRQIKNDKKSLQGIKNLSHVKLDKAIPVASYDENHPVLDIQGIDSKLLEVEPPIYTFVSLNTKSVCEQADKSLTPMDYKEGIYSYDTSDLHHKKEIIFGAEADQLIQKIKKDHINSLIDSLAA